MAPNSAAGQNARSTCKVASEQEDPVKSGTSGDIHVMDGSVLAVHAVGPVGKHLLTVGVSGNAQSEINV